MILAEIFGDADMNKISDMLNVEVSDYWQHIIHLTKHLRKQTQTDRNSGYTKSYYQRNSAICVFITQANFTTKPTFKTKLLILSLPAEDNRISKRKS